MSRPTYTRHDVRAGCHECHGGEAHWYDKNAQGVAARHHDAIGHRTWVEVSLAVHYGHPESVTLRAAEAARKEAAAVEGD
jgi:hypothetical protein